jgi:hypothetical protein
MKRRPLAIILITILYFLEPVGNVLQAAFINDMPLFGRYGILSHLFWADWIVLISFPIVGIGVYKVRKWGWYLFICFSAVLIAYNLLVYYYLNPGYVPETIFLFILIITGITALFFRRHVYSPYFNPRLRWWETAARFRVILETDMSTSHGSFHCETVDISESGCFVETREGLKEGEPVWLRIRCRGIEINCLGRVVRKAGPREKAQGYGIMFEGMAKETRRKVRSLIYSLERLDCEDRTGVIPEEKIPQDFVVRDYNVLGEIALQVKSYVKHAFERS